MLDTIIGILVAIGMMWLVGRWDTKRAGTFLEKWPPISDDEFVAKCPGVVNREVALKVRRIISQQLGIP